MNLRGPVSCSMLSSVVLPAVWMACWAWGCGRAFDREATLEQAGQAVRRTDYGAAAHLLQEVLDHAPDDAGTRYYLGLILLRSGHPVQARMQFFRTAQIDSAHQGALSQLGTMAYNAGDQGEALDLLERAVRAGVQEAHIHDLLAYLYQKQGRADDARSHLLAAKRLARTQPRYRLKLGVLEHLAGRYGAARGELEALAADYPDLWEAHFMLGRVYRDLNMNEAAAGCLERARRLKQNQADVHYHLGAVRLQMGQPAPAAQAFLEAVGLSPGYMEAYYSLAQAYTKMGQKAEAGTAMRRFRELQQEVARQGEKSKAFISHWRQGVLEGGKGDHAAAVQSFRKALQIEPDDLYSRLLLYRAYRASGRGREADEMLRGARELLGARTTGEAFTDVGIELMRRGEAEMAAEVLEEAVSQDPTLLRAHYYLTALYNRLQRPDRAAPHVKVLEGAEEER